MYNENFKKESRHTEIQLTHSRYRLMSDLENSNESNQKFSSYFIRSSLR